MNKLKLLIAVICLAQAGFAQNRANIWYFGTFAGLDFNSGTPVAILDGQIATIEGVASIADTNGALLFYTDGITVWNKNHQVMPNGTGLFGNVSSSQSAIIVPKPQSADVYYIFTVDELGFALGFNYSEVDMSLNGGLGDITANKNVQLLPRSTEQVTAVAHANGTDIWVVTHGFNNNVFEVFRVTPTGITTTPVTSTAGITLAMENDTVGYMKISPDGTKLAMSNYDSGSQVCNFNTATGVVSGGTSLQLIQFNYGVEFSPSGNLLYTSSAANGELIQYDMDAANIPASAVTIAPAGIEVGGALQLGPDGKIYYSRGFTTTLSVINNPDAAGLACNYAQGTIDLGGRSSTYGLPPFIQSFFLPDLKFENLCLGDTTEFTIAGPATPDSALWDFGDGASSTAISPTHVYALAGTYTVTVIATKQGVDRTLTKNITILPLPSATQPADLSACDPDANGQESFNLALQDAAILGTQAPTSFTVTYHTTLENAQDGINPLPDNYTNIANPQTIFARVTSLAGCHSETSFQLIVRPKPEIDMGQEYILCEGGAVQLIGPLGFDGYLWSNGAATRIAAVDTPGTYTLTVFRDYGSEICEASQEVSVTLSGSPYIIDITIDDWTENNNSITIVAGGLGDNEYSIDGTNWQAGNVFTGLESGIHTVYARDKNGCGQVSKEVYLLTYPKFFTPNGDGENETWRIHYAHFEPHMLVHVFDRYGKLITSFKGSDAGWDGSLNGQRLPSTDYWFVVQREDGREFKGHFSMMR